jgi:hypothetical protein
MAGAARRTKVCILAGLKHHAPHVGCVGNQPVAWVERGMGPDSCMVLLRPVPNTAWLGRSCSPYHLERVLPLSFLLALTKVQLRHGVDKAARQTQYRWLLDDYRKPWMGVPMRARR